MWPLMLFVAVWFLMLPNMFSSETLIVFGTSAEKPLNGLDIISNTTWKCVIKRLKKPHPYTLNRKRDKQFDNTKWLQSGREEKKNRSEHSLLFVTQTKTQFNQHLLHSYSSCEITWFFFLLVLLLLSLWSFGVALCFYSLDVEVEMCKHRIGLAVFANSILVSGTSYVRVNEQEDVKEKENE